MASEKVKLYSLDKLKDEFIGPEGSPERTQYEYELKMEILGKLIKEARKRRGLTQEQLGQLLGVQKAWVSKIESSASNASISTIVKVFKALDAEVTISVKMENQHLELNS
ncbi:MAG: transcriptional regulator [Phyllobacteriaceae bacterium]|nr:transcriptional regulator [Phyllobacteriaceae bacterium]